jgi:hypothetical protein
MNLTGVIAISGRPGLYKVVAQGKNNVIVESLDDKKRFPAYSSDRISALEDISIYTYDEDKPLKEIIATIFEKENGGPAISHKESEANLVAYISEVLPNYDQERVYVSDIKKIFQWYNLCHKAGLLVVEKNDEVVAEELKEEGAPKKKAAPKAKSASPKAKKEDVVR